MADLSAASVPRSASERASVLVVDDDPAYQKLVQTVLQSRYAVAVAVDGITGLNAVRDQRPQLAVVDVQMPGMDGLQLLSAIRSDVALASIKVIMLTADASRETVMAAVRAGADDYLIKTAFSKDELIRKIERLLQPQSEASQAILRSTSEMPGMTAATSKPAEVARELNGPHHTALTSQPAPVGVEGIGTKAAGQDPTHLQEILDSWD